MAVVDVEELAKKQGLTKLAERELEKVIGGARDPNWKPENVVNAVSVNVTEFEAELVRLNPSERVAKVLDKAREIAKHKGWGKTSLSAKNGGREIYYDNNSKKYYAVDTQHGRFELYNKRGKHLGELKFDFTPVKNSMDISRGHDIFI